jgi:hypothetical protein
MLGRDSDIKRRKAFSIDLLFAQESNPSIWGLDGRLMEEKQREKIREILPVNDFPLLDRRLSRPSTRYRFLLYAWSYITGHPLEEALDFPEILRLAALSELDMTIMYHENHIRDQKFTVRRSNQKSIDRKRAEKEKLRIYKEEFISENFREDLRNKISETNYWIHRLHDQNGMDLDKGMTSLDNFLLNKIPHSFSLNGLHLNEEKTDLGIPIDNPPPTFDIDVFIAEIKTEISYINRPEYHKLSCLFEKEAYLHLYFKRTYYLNTVLYELYTQLLVEEFAAQKEKFSHLIKFARYYGMIQQIINDNLDFLPLSHFLENPCKIQEDTFSDLREQNVTLPILFYLQLKEKEIGILSDENLIYSILNSPNEPVSLRKDEHIQYAILNELFSSKALSMSKKIGVVLASKAKKILDSDNLISDNLISDKTTSPYFLKMIDVAIRNKGYETYSKIQKGLD